MEANETANKSFLAEIEELGEIFVRKANITKMTNMTTRERFMCEASIMDTNYRERGGDDDEEEDEEEEE